MVLNYNKLGRKVYNDTVRAKDRKGVLVYQVCTSSCNNFYQNFYMVLIALNQKMNTYNESREYIVYSAYLLIYSNLGSYNNFDQNY